MESLPDQVGAELDTSFVEGVGDEVLLAATVGVILLSAAVLLFRPLVDWNSAPDRPRQQTMEQNGVTPAAAADTLTEADGAGEPAPAVAAVPVRTRQQRGSADSACPICLAEVRHGIETNCGHLFCATCLFAYRDHGRTTGPMKCPLCRQQVTLLFPCFPESDLSVDDPAEVVPRETARQEVHRYNRRFSGEPREWMEYLRDLPTLLRHLWTEFFSEDGLFVMFRIRVVVCFLAAVFYVISPLDILPEAIFGLLGLFDDIFILVLILIYVSVIYRHYVAARN